MSVPTLDTPVFDHLSIGVSDLDRSVAFYDAALAPLGLVRLFRSPRAAGYGPEGFAGEAPFALVAAAEVGPMRGLHVAFIATTRAAVDAFHAAALAHAGTDDGAPGIRSHYDPGYYAAFVRDPDGHRLEAVLHE
jgi:catechol 2,3-dioxygenase-like lactoylglutathione lyase family enzyme